MSQSTGFYGRLARFAIQQRAITLGAVALVTLLAGFFAMRLRVDSDILALMPQDDPSTRALQKLDREEQGVNFLTIAVDGADSERRDAFMKALAADLEALPEVEYVLYTLDPDVAWRLGLLQIADDDLLALRDRLRAAISLGPAAANPFVAARLFDLGPLSEKLSRAGEGVQLDSSGDVARMIVRPRGSAHDLPFAQKFMHDVDAAVVRADAAAHGVTIRWIGGAYRHNVEDYEGIVRDIGWITGASFVLVLAIVAFAFRTTRALVIIFAPLIVANVVMLGIAGGTVGALNTFTSSVVAILIGLGVDFGVHLYARYREERARGTSVEAAVIRAWDLVGSACSSACITTAAGFGALLAAHFAGFRQLGWLLSLGVLLCLVAELVLMPILIVTLERQQLRSHASSFMRRMRNRRRRPSTYRLAPVALLLMACFTLVSALLIRRTSFEYDLSELRRAGLAYADLDENEKALARDSYAPVIASFPTQTALDAAHARISERVANGQIPQISRVLSIRTALPAEQEDRLSLLQELVALGQDPNARYLPPQVQQTLARLAATELSPMTPADLPPSLQHLLGASSGRHRLLMIPDGNMWDMREAALLEGVMERELPGVEVASEYLTLGALYALMQRDAPVIGVIALGLVALVTALDLRSVRATAGALAVLLSGCAWWGALLVLSDIKLSIVNFVGIPIVLGIGIDVMIHLLHRMRQEGPGRILKSLATTGWASALATSTTVVAFAALSLASSEGIRSLGLLVLLGELAVALAGFVLIPLGFATRWRLQGRLPIAEDATNPGVDAS